MVGPRKTWSMKRLIDWVEFLSPNGMGTNSNKPNGVEIAMFGTLEGFTSIWWYARTKSILEKIDAPFSEVERLWMYGIGCQSGMAIQLNAL